MGAAFWINRTQTLLRFLESQALGEGFSGREGQMNLALTSWDLPLLTPISPATGKCSLFLPAVQPFNYYNILKSLFGVVW